MGAWHLRLSLEAAEGRGSLVILIVIIATLGIFI